MLRGTAAGLEFVFAGRPFEEAWTDIADRLAERPDFYRGSQATAIFEGVAPDELGMERFLETVRGYGITLRGVHGNEALEAVAVRHALTFLGEPPRPTVASFERKRAARAGKIEIPEKARSLDADFAGARADIASRRARGEPSVPRPVFAPVATAPAPEIVATGDIVVFGALRGTAHAGAQGDLGARVFALELAATQLRIATLIAADDGARGTRPREPEVAFVEGDRIALAPYAKIGVAP
jgi:hypothetical protein